MHVWLVLAHPLLCHPQYLAVSTQLVNTLEENISNSSFLAIRFSTWNAFSKYDFIKVGVLSDVEVILGLHFDHKTPTSSITAHLRPFLSTNVLFFKIRLEGKSEHAIELHSNVDLMLATG